MQTILAKEILSEYLPLAIENRNRIARLNDMRDAASGLSGIPESDGSAHTNTNSHKMETAIERIMEYEEQIAPILEANTKRMNEIEQAVIRLEDPLQREVLRLRYMEPELGKTCRKKKWTVIAILLYGKEDPKYIKAAQRLHMKALQNFIF